MNRDPPDAALPLPDRNGEKETGRADVVESLTSYDDRLRQGSERSTARTDPNSPMDSGPPTELVDCLHLLERIWPRTGADAAPASLPERVGRFEIQRVLGHGGFGIVYLATDPVLNRQVALKVPRLHSLADDELRERLRREARAAAALDHPNIVPIHETGEDGPVCYIAAVYCPGPNLAEWLKQQTTPVSPRLAATLISSLADAVHYSHTHGVLHRDLKSSNVMLAPPSEDVTGATEGDLPFIPRLTDFGLAKLLEDQPEETAASAMLGTPAYMAPEQAGGSPETIGPQTDVYALGVILYELLAGRPPFQGDSVADVLDQVRHSEPLAPRRLRRDIPRDLETICLKCLEKAPRGRFATARELAEELQRFLRGQPLRVRPPGPVRLALKWIRRRRLAAALIATVTVVAVALPALLIAHNRRLSMLTDELQNSLGTANHWRARTDALRQTAEQAARDAEQGRRAAVQAGKLVETQRRVTAQAAYASSVRLAELAWLGSDIRQCRTLLAAARQHTDAEQPPGVEWHFLDHQTRAGCRELGDPLEQFFCVAPAPDGRTLAAGGAGGVVQIIEVASGLATRVLATNHGLVRGVAFSRAGDRVAVCGDDKTISVWNATTGERLLVSSPAPGELHALAWLFGDEWVAAVGGFPAVHLWKVSSEDETANLPTDPEKVTGLTTSRDGRRLAAGGHDGTVWIWDAVDRKLLFSFQNGRMKVTSLAFSQDANYLAVGDNDRRVRVCRVSGDDQIFEFEILLKDAVRSLAFSPGDDRLAILEQFGTLQVWGLALKQPLPRKKRAFGKGWQSHEERGSQLAFLPDGSNLVSVGRGSSRPRLWNAGIPRSGRWLAVPPLDNGHRMPLQFTPDSERLIAAGVGIQFWSAHSLECLFALTREPLVRECLATSLDGRWLAAGSYTSNVVELWDVSQADSQPIWRVPDQKADGLAFAPDGESIAVVDWINDAVVLFDRRSGERLRSLPARQCHEAAFSPDGRYLAVDDQDDIAVWSTESWTVVARLEGHLSTILTLSFSPDGRCLASAGLDREIRLWSTDDWSFIRGMNGHRAKVAMLRFTSDSRSLVALDGDEVIKVWHPATGLELCNLRTPADGRASQFALSPDTRRLAIRLPDGRVELRQLWTGD